MPRTNSVVAGSHQLFSLSCTHRSRSPASRSVLHTAPATPWSALGATRRGLWDRWLLLTHGAVPISSDAGRAPRARASARSQSIPSSGASTRDSSIGLSCARGPLERCLYLQGRPRRLHGARCGSRRSGRRGSLSEGRRAARVNSEWSEGRARRPRDRLGCRAPRRPSAFAPDSVACVPERQHGRRDAPVLERPSCVPSGRACPFLGCRRLPASGEARRDEGSLAGTVVISCARGPAIELALRWQARRRSPSGRDRSFRRARPRTHRLSPGVACRVPGAAEWPAAPRGPGF
jgi:hypothetical protein